jgi:hypothetical protein
MEMKNQKGNFMSKMSETKLTEQEIEVIRNNRDNVDWSHISEYQKLSEDFIREFKDNIHWSYISAYQKLSEEFIREFKDDVDWYYISTHQKLSEDFIREFKNRVDWCYISGYQKLSEDFIREFRYNVDWCCIFMFQKLSEDFIREFKNKANWHNVSSYQELSEDFIREFRHNVNWNRISKCQKLSKKFIREFSLSIIKDKRTIEDKRNEMMDYANKHNLKFENDTLFAFREHDKWNRGVYNKTIYYDEPGYYKDWHCDLNPKNENSFGLGIFPQGNTPVSVSVEDWGVVVNDSKKARVLAFTKLN